MTLQEELDKGYTLKVSIGTDSQKVTKGEYKFATVILISTSEDLGGVVVGRGGVGVCEASCRWVGGAWMDGWVHEWAASNAT